jgi:hypothetical protein
MYDNLYDIYGEIDQKLYDIVGGQNQSIADIHRKAAFPLFLVPSKKYNDADIKIMVFGQETNGWIGVYGDPDNKEDKDVDFMLDEYDRFFNGREWYNYGKQFWSTIKEIIGRLQETQQDKKIGYIWNTVIKMGLYGRSQTNHFPREWYKSIIKPYLNDIIIQEIEILKPDFIIFFSGPDYDRVLNDIFNNPARKKIEGFTERELCEIEIKKVKKAFRTYHPGFLLHLNKIRPYTEYIEKIIGEIANNL